MILDGFLIAIIIGLIIERYFYSRDMNKQVHDCMKALLSRNIDDFVHATAIEKVKPNKKEEDPDVVPLSQATDEQFIKAIQEI